MPDVETAVSRRRRVAFLILAGVLGVAVALPLFGWPSLVLGWFETGDRLAHRVHDLSYGIWAGILLAVGYLSQLRAPERRVAGFQQAALALVGFALAGTLAGDGTALLFVLGFAVLTAILGWLHPAREHVLVRGEGPSMPLLVLALLAAVPLTVFAFDMAELQRTGIPSDTHVAERHWSTMATLALSIWLVAAQAALRTPGWRIPAWSAGLAAAVLGVASMVFPAYPGSLGRTWGLVALLGGVVFVALAEWTYRREPSRRLTPTD
jgi:MFS family permease